MARASREHYTRLEPHETEHRHPTCGCTLRLLEHGGVALYQCALHEAAEDLLKACTFLVDHHLPVCDETCHVIGIDQMRRAIRKAEGVAQ